MKNLLKLFVPMTVAVMSLAACNKEMKAPEPEFHITVRAIPEAMKTDAPKADAPTKTYIDGSNAIIWGTGEYMKLALTAGETTTFANSTDASADAFNGDPEALFEFNVSPETAANYTYQGLYPASAAAASSNTNAANYKVNLPAIQNATASSYDPAAYIMVAKPESFDAVQTDWVASFRRGTALNKVTLKNFGSSVSINKVKITAENKKLAGGRHFNLTAGEGLEVYGTDATIDVLYATPLTGTTMDVWFTSWDAEIAEGEKLTIVAYTTDSKSYTKEITVPAGKTIKFQEGYLNTLGANMSGITPENVATIDGDYVILAENSGHYYALKGEASGTRIASVDYTGSTSSYSGDASLVWTITTSGSGYTIKNGSNFIGWTLGNTADLVDEASYDANQCLMRIDDNGDGTYKIYVAADPTRILARNSSNAYFGFYTGSGYNNLVLVPATALETVATPTFNPAAGEVTSGTEVTISTTTDGATIYYTTDGSTPTTSSTQGTSVTITAATTIKAIAVKDGMADSEIASAQYTVSGTEKTYYVKVTSEPSDWSGTYLIVSGSVVFTGAFSGASTYYGLTENVTITDDKIESTAIVDAYAVTIAQSESCYSIETNENGFLSWTSGNSLNHTASAGSNNQRWSLTYSNGNVTIANASDDTRKLQYNSGNPRFACYTSNQAAIQLYKLETSATPAVTWNLNSIEITTPPTKTTYTEGESFDPAGMVVTGHFVDADDNTNTKDEEVTGYTITPDGALSTTDNHVTITYQGKTTTQAITVNPAPVVTYDFETVAELNALVTSTSTEYSGYLTDAVVSFVPATNTAIVKDATGSVMFYKSGHGLKQGQTYTGAINVTAIKYNSLYSEITVWDASFTGSEATVAPEVVTLSSLIGHYDDYQNAYVQVAGLTVSSVDGKNIHVTDGLNSYVVYDNTSSVSVAAGDVITAVGTVTKYQTTEEIKVWKAADVIVTASAPKAITFSQPTGAAGTAGCSFTVSVGGSPISSGDTVASGTTVTLTATAGTDYEFTSWAVTGATVANASSASTTFVMGTSAVNISAAFTNTGSTTNTYVDNLSQSWTGISGTNYAAWTGKAGSASSAVYAGNSAGGNSSIQLRSNNSNSGVVSTTSGGKVKKIVVAWNSNTTNGRTLNIYGKNSAYSQATDLYSANSQGTLLGTIVCGTSTELTITGDYTYVGFRSNSGAMYLDEVDITWEN